MRIQRLHPDFGAEIHGIGLIDAASDAGAFAQVRAAFEEYSVLVWRDQPITDDVQAVFSRGFGPLELVKVGSAGHGTFYSRMSNIGPDGKIVPPSDKALLIARANQLWHTDSSFKKVPAVASVLSARVIPEQGGETEFTSTRAAWERLRPSEQAQLRDAVAIHSYATSRNQIDPTMMTPEEHASLPPVRRRLTWCNPVNGRRSLYLASHAGGIEGMGEREGAELLAYLMAHATEPAHTYAHSWKPGDVVMWDNRATMHRGKPWGPAQLRSIVRTTISATEEHGVRDVLPELWDQRAAA
ncbi:TauD/TfdA dioxygenase family protein [Bordetella bronchialis]|uniref:Taurine catabolism dioxygenase TauD n=1 Tax=Bordetella bronchialis TaxID=463025 RepID=A0A193FRT6_9BORD|nr:TauD/TfdA family dioxygenase [Bordetella bronchialis]ANN65432.1 taurine catabolism dioxygenase TauD [Bordetella bronchialis]ANN70462.1 taurine catabolism dioxygenase TauD [Bordetella bronchialis]